MAEINSTSTVSPEKNTAIKIKMAPFKNSKIPTRPLKRDGRGFEACDLIDVLSKGY